MPNQLNKFNLLSLKQFRSLFASLAIPLPDTILGTYHAAFVGPTWLRTAAAPALSVSGLGGWWGKEFLTDGSATNIVLRAGVFSSLFQMRLIETRSFIDQKHGLALHYQPESPFPWMFVVDELRRLDETSLLGMTIANLQGLRGLAFPFILQKTDAKWRS
ncbi:MAG: hypothetical protein NTW32_02230 [Chloroflexi bacterium]|nr:hypothetical protein [Chloroflexota bacterium]